jgi:hypothetical protein
MTSGELGLTYIKMWHCGGLMDKCFDYHRSNWNYIAVIRTGIVPCNWEATTMNDRSRHWVGGLSYSALDSVTIWALFVRNSALYVKNWVRRLIKKCPLFANKACHVYFYQTLWQKRQHVIKINCITLQIRSKADFKSKSQNIWQQIILFSNRCS